MIVAGEKTQVMALSQWARDAVDLSIRVVGARVTAVHRVRLLAAHGGQPASRTVDVGALRQLVLALFWAVRLLLVSLDIGKPAQPERTSLDFGVPPSRAAPTLGDPSGVTPHQ